MFRAFDKLFFYSTLIIKTNLHISIGYKKEVLELLRLLYDLFFKTCFTSIMFYGQ